MGCLRAPPQASQFGLQAPAELGCALASKAAAEAASKAAAVAASAAAAAAAAVSLTPVVGLLGWKERGRMGAFPWLLVLARRMEHKEIRSLLLQGPIGLACLRRRSRWSLLRTGACGPGFLGECGHQLAVLRRRLRRKLRNLDSDDGEEARGDEVQPQQRRAHVHAL